MKFFRIFKRKVQNKQKLINFHEFDNAMFSLFMEKEKKGDDFLDVYEVAKKYLESKGKDLDINLYIEGIIDYFDYLISGREDKLDKAIRRLKKFIDRSKEVYHSQYYLAKAYYHKSSISSDSVKYKNLSDFYLEKFNEKKAKSHVE